VWEGVAIVRSLFGPGNQRRSSKV